MLKRLFASSFLLLFSLPAMAKPHDLYPVSCEALWTAVKSALDSPNDYVLIFSDDQMHRASFSVIGELTTYKDTVSLMSSGDGCQMKLNVLQVGPDNSDERGFRKRLGKALARLSSVATRPPDVPPAAPAQGDAAAGH